MKVGEELEDLNDDPFKELDDAMNESMPGGDDDSGGTKEFGTQEKRSRVVPTPEHSRENQQSGKDDGLDDDEPDGKPDDPILHGEIERKRAADKAARKAAESEKAKKADEGNDPDPKPDDDTDDTDDEVVTRNMSAAQKANWKALRGKAAEADKLNKQIADLQAQANDTKGKLPEDVEQELQQLRDMRAKVFIQQDPSFKEKYEKPVQASKDKVLDILRSAGQSDEDLKVIEDQKWFDKGIDQWQKGIIKGLKNSGDSKQQDAAILLEQELINLRGKELDLNKAKSGEMDIGSYQKEVQQRQIEEHKSEIQFLENQVQDIVSKVPWLQLQDVEAAEDKEAAKAHNDQIGQYKQLFNEVFLAYKPQDRFKVAQLAVLGLRRSFENTALSEQLQTASTENERLKSDLSKLKGARRLPHTSSPNSVPARGDFLDGSAMESTSAAFDDHFSK